MLYACTFGVYLGWIKIARNKNKVEGADSKQCKNDTKTEGEIS